MLECRPGNFHIMLSGKLVKMVSGKAVKYKLFWNGNKKGVAGVNIQARKLGEKETVVIAEDVTGHVRSITDTFQDQYGGYGSGVRNNEREQILDFCAAINITMRNSFLKKKESHLVPYESGLSKTEADYCFMRRNQRKIVKLIKVFCR